MLSTSAKLIIIFMATAPDGSPVNVMAQSFYSTSIYVEWEQVHEIDRNGVIVMYEVYYEPLETFDGMIMKERVTTPDLFYIITGLEEYVDYNITVRAYTSEGPGPYSTAIIEMTLEDGTLPLLC